ncbi:MAG TPA: DUF424 family protein [Thermoplasmata archaeon]|jgi:hypothetical protein|nr:DUF424 family protein [Thermoplasmata archaeon]
MICMKIHGQGQKLLLAACDEELLGKSYSSDGLKMTVSEGFYHADIGDEESLVSRLQVSAMANLVGKMTIDVAVRHGFVDPECILVIGGVPHAQMVRMI